MDQVADKEKELEEKKVEVGNSTKVNPLEQQTNQVPSEQIQQGKLSLKEMAARASQSSPGATVVANAQAQAAKVLQSMDKRPVIKNARAAQEGQPRCFYSQKPGFSFIYKRTRTQVRFDGNFFRTYDDALARTIERSYGNEAQEISEQDYVDGTMLRNGAPEPTKSVIAVNRLPGGR